jgi:hypothetical protein
MRSAGLMSIELVFRWQFDEQEIALADAATAYLSGWNAARPFPYERGGKLFKSLILKALMDCNRNFPALSKTMLASMQTHGHSCRKRTFSKKSPITKKGRRQKLPPHVRLRQLKRKSLRRLLREYNDLTSQR